MSIESRRWDLAAEYAAGHIPDTDLPALAHLVGTDTGTIRRMALMVSKTGWRKHE